jgi:triphosphoribosyl-dephospho-CoA synthase
MADPLDSLRRLIGSPAGAVRWACLLEAISPKAGNVYPGRSFSDLSFADFVSAAEIASKQMADSRRRISERMLMAVEETVSMTKTNVNLGMVLLLGPLVAADEMMAGRGEIRGVETWATVIGEVLGAMDGVDGRNIFRAIRVAPAGGLGSASAMDVHTTGGEVDILAAMTLARDRDRIARQYAVGFTDLLETIAPVVGESISQRGDLLGGIQDAQLRLLRSEPDSLIARKNGVEVAATVQKRARGLDLDDPTRVAQFDAFLRSDSHQLNPGTTADLIAAALYVLLRTPAS